MNTFIINYTAIYMVICLPLVRAKNKCDSTRLELFHIDGNGVIRNQFFISTKVKVRKMSSFVRSFDPIAKKAAIAYVLSFQSWSCCTFLFILFP